VIRCYRFPKTGQPENKVEKFGMFLATEKHHTKHHNYHAFHHNFTTFLPPRNTQKSQKPLQKPAISQNNFL
jgi:hypothetical protein